METLLTSVSNFGKELSKCVRCCLQTRIKYCWVFCSGKFTFPITQAVHWALRRIALDLHTAEMIRHHLIVSCVAMFSCLSAVQSRFEDRLSVYWSDVGVENVDMQQQHNTNVSRWAPPDFLRRLFVFSAVFCANWGVTPSGLTFRGTDDAVDPWKRPWALSPPAAAGETVTGMPNELNAVKSLNSFSTPRLSLSLSL